MNFIHKIIASINKFHNHNAFCIKNKYYSYRDLFSLIIAIQNVIERQCGNDDKIGVIASDDIETYASILAILLAGKTYIPIHPHQPAERIQHSIAQSGLTHILSRSITHSYKDATIVSTGDLRITDTDQKLIVAPFSPDIAAYILFTSGSTGIPKGVPITYHNLDSFIGAFFALGYLLDETDRVLQMFDLTFDLSVMSYLVPLCVGACVYTIPDTGTKFTHVYTVLEEHKITCALMVPSIITYLRPYFDEINLPELRYSLFCGEALYTDVVTEWGQCVPNALIENVYGPTEATIFCLSYNVSRTRSVAEYNGIVAIGNPMKNMEAITVDAHNAILPIGEKGELCLWGAQLTPGYLDAKKNKAAFFELGGKKYYRTGDIVYRNEQGDFMYCGRVDHQVKIQGFRVELSEIEFHLREITGHSNVVALAINNVNGLNQIDAVFDTELSDKEAVLDKLKTKLPSYMIPSRMHVVPAFPLNANGKTDRKKLEQILVQSL